jgi:hypothetical protein
LWRVIFLCSASPPTHHHRINQHYFTMRVLFLFIALIAGANAFGVYYYIVSLQFKGFRKRAINQLMKGGSIAIFTMVFYRGGDGRTIENCSVVEKYDVYHSMRCNRSFLHNLVSSLTPLSIYMMLTSPPSLSYLQ